jgi:hypothetical protein
MAKISGIHIPAERKNLAINGALDFWQRVESSTTTVNTTSTVGTYTADMFVYASAGSTNKNYSVAQSSNVPTLAQSGFESTYSYLFTMLTGISSFAANDYVIPFQYRMEGLDYQRIHGKSVTFGFWAYATAAGTYNFALVNGSGNRSYVTTFSISSSNTWQYITVTVTLDSVTTGWLFTNGIGLQVLIGSYAGSTYQTSSLGSWQGGNLFVASTSTNWMATTSNVLQITQFSIVEGSLGFSSTGFLRAGKSIQQELALCQRYYEKTYDIGTAVGSATNVSAFQCGDVGDTSGNHSFKILFKVVKRAAPTMTVWDFAGTSTDINGTASSGSTITFGPLGAAACAVDATGAGGFVAHTFSYSSSNPGIVSGHFAADAGL